MVQYIRGEGVELFERPKPPSDQLDNNESRNRSQVRVVRDNASKSTKDDEDDKSSHQSQHRSQRDFAADPEWTGYCEWLQNLSKQAVEHFLRGIHIGVQLGESWLVSQGVTYVWNYLHHRAEKRQFNQVVSVLSECLDALRKAGHNNEPELLVAVTVALANGLMQNWLPREQVKSLQVPVLGFESSTAAANEKHNRKANMIATGAANPQVKIQFTLTTEAQNDIKKAIEVNRSNKETH